MRKLLFFSVLLMILASVSIAFASPFSDVPKDHWAFEAIDTLHSKGIIDGYADGTFKGNKVVSRYHLAMVIAKMLVSVEQKRGTISKADLKVIERLTMEFADELALMSIKVKSLQSDLEDIKEEVSGIKKDVHNISEFIKNGGNDKVKISGDIVIRNYDLKQKNAFHRNRTESMFRVHLDTRISEKISVHTGWNVIQDQNDRNAPFATNEWNGGNKNTGDVEEAYFKFKNTFKTDDSLKVGRFWYSHGHGLVVHDFVDGISYSQKRKSADLTLNCFFDRNNSFQRQKDYLNIWNLNLDYYYRSHKLYLGFYYNSRDFINEYDIWAPEGEELSQRKINKNKSDRRIELGASGPIGKKNSKLTYDLASVHNESKDYIRFRNNGKIFDYKGWLSYGAVKYDTKKDFSFKLAYTYAEEESVSQFRRNDFNSYCMREETPFDDLAIANIAVTNLKDAKIQIGYRFKNASKHSLRLAYDKLEAKNKQVPNDTTLITFEYKYQLSENTRVRFVYQNAKYKDGYYYSWQPIQPNTRESIFITEIYARF